ncbi:MAG: hypothetical protein ABIJ18_02180 [archaeon]
MASSFVSNILIFIVIFIAFIIFWGFFTRVGRSVSRLAKLEIRRSKREDGFFSSISNTTSSILEGLGHAEFVRPSGKIEKPPSKVDTNSLKVYKEGIKKIDSNVQSLRKSLNEDRKTISLLKRKTISNLSDLEKEQNSLNGLDYAHIVNPVKNNVSEKIGKYNSLLMTLQSMELNDQQDVDNIRKKVAEIEALIPKAMYDIDLAIQETNPQDTLDNFVQKLTELQSLEIEARQMQDERKQFLNNISQLSSQLDNLEKDIKNRVNQAKQAVKVAKKQENASAQQLKEAIQNP